MSEQRVTVGVIGLLELPIGNSRTEEWEELTERLDASGSLLKITYGGDMVVYRHQDGPVYDAGLIIFDENDNMFDVFKEELSMAGIHIVEGTAKMFVDNWYDGCDAPHMMLTLEEAGFRK